MTLMASGLKANLNWLRRSFSRRRRNLPRLPDRPISRSFGFDRGTPIDRYYIEQFLSEHRRAIRGHTLEVGDDHYTRRFGDDRTTRRDVLHLYSNSGNVAFVGDIADPDTLPTAAFDCAVITQTLHLIPEMRVAIERLYNALKPGGVLLLTVPGISQIAEDEWGKGWYWSLTTASAKYLFDGVFGEAQVTVQHFGNYFAAIAFLTGAAADEVPKAKLNRVDLSYPVTIAVRAQRPLVDPLDDHLPLAERAYG